MPPGIGYGKRPKVKKRAVESGVFQAANIDTAGLDPEMRSTLAGEAARRVGAAGVGVRTRNPLDEVGKAIRKLFGKR